MSLPMSHGLQQLLREDPAYAGRYERLVRHVENLPAMELLDEYAPEHNSWKNRKHTAKKEGIHWSPFMEKFPHFLLVIGPIPVVHWTLDRVDPTGHYVPENLRWASKADQSQNRTCARRIAVGGEVLTINEVARRTGRNYDAVRMSLDRHGNEYAIYLLNNPQVDPEHAWQFPEECRQDCLEKLYDARREKEWSRMYFFIDLAHRDFYRIKSELETTTGEMVKKELEIELATLRELHNSTLKKWRHFRAAADSRRKFPNAVVPKRPVYDDEPDDSDYWPDEFF